MTLLIQLFSQNDNNGANRCHEWNFFRWCNSRLFIHCLDSHGIWPPPHDSTSIMCLHYWSSFDGWLSQHSYVSRLAIHHGLGSWYDHYDGLWKYVRRHSSYPSENSPADCNAVPLYQAELSPPNSRGFHVGLHGSGLGCSYSQYCAAALFVGVAPISMHSERPKTQVQKLTRLVGFANIGYLFYVVFVCLDVCTFMFVWKYIPEVRLLFQMGGNVLTRTR